MFWPIPNFYYNDVILFLKFRKHLGYCPQFETLIDGMTCIQTLYLYARLRGIKEKPIEKTCTSIMNMLDLTEHAKKMVFKNLKRK